MNYIYDINADKSTNPVAGTAMYAIPINGAVWLDHLNLPEWDGVLEKAMTDMGFVVKSVPMTTIAANKANQGVEV